MDSEPSRELIPSLHETFPSICEKVEETSTGTKYKSEFYGIKADYEVFSSDDADMGEVFLQSLYETPWNVAKKEMDSEPSRELIPSLHEIFPSIGEKVEERSTGTKSEDEVYFSDDTDMGDEFNNDDSNFKN
jgi:hypothetical protein